MSWFRCILSSGVSSAYSLLVRVRDIKVTAPGGALTLERGMGMCRGHDPLFSGQSPLPSPPIYRQCAALVPSVLIFLENFCIFNHVLAKILALKTQIFPNFRSQDPHFLKENPLPRPYILKPAWHIPTKKKLSAPPGVTAQNEVHSSPLCEVC